MPSIITKKDRDQRTIKAFDVDIALINERAKGLSCSAAEIIHDLCDTLRKDVYLQELGESFDLLCTNPEQLVEFKAGQKAWDCALSDGLSDAS